MLMEYGGQDERTMFRGLDDIFIWLNRSKNDTHWVQYLLLGGTFGELSSLMSRVGRVLWDVSCFGGEWEFWSSDYTSCCLWIRWFALRIEVFECP